MTTRTHPSSVRQRLGLLGMLGALMFSSVVACDDDKQTPAVASVSASARPSPRPAPALPGVPWPALPEKPADAERVISDNTPANTAAPDAGALAEDSDSWSAEAISALLRQRQLEGRLIAGWRPISGWFQKRLDAAATRNHDGYMLFGTYHDAAAQLRAFRRVLGSLERLNAAPVEHFQADGHWVADVRPWVQKGDSTDLSEFLRTGSATSWSRLLVGRNDHNYSVWKFGLVQDLMDLVVESRARNLPLLPCDMPSELQKTLSRRLDTQQADSVLRLRELHCLWTLRDALKDTPHPWRVAMLWGQSHIARNALPRFLAPNSEAVRVYVFGDRFDPAFGVESKLAKLVSITDPVLVPIDVSGERVLLLLPGRDLGARLEKKREQVSDLTPGLRVTSTLPGKLLVDRRTFDIASGATQILIPAGNASYTFESTQGLLVGALSLPRQGALELELDSRQRSVLLTLKVGR